MLICWLAGSLIAGELQAPVVGGETTTDTLFGHVLIDGYQWLCDETHGRHRLRNTRFFIVSI
jgi:hypothetical protein